MRVSTIPRRLHIKNPCNDPSWKCSYGTRLAGCKSVFTRGPARSEPLGRAADYSADPDWLHKANESVGVLAMIEGMLGMESLDSILEVGGLDSIFLGSVDLAQSLGVGNQSEHSQVFEAVHVAAEKAAGKNKAIAVFAPSSQADKLWIELGVSIVASSEDTAVMGGALRMLRSEVLEFS